MIFLPKFLCFFLIQLLSTFLVEALVTDICKYRGCLIEPSGGCALHNGQCYIQSDGHNQTELINVIMDAVCQWPIGDKLAFQSYLNAMKAIVNDPTLHQGEKINRLICLMTGYAQTDNTHNLELREKFRSIRFQTWVGYSGPLDINAFIRCGQVFGEDLGISEPTCCCPLNFNYTTSTGTQCGNQIEPTTLSPIKTKCALDWQESVPVYKSYKNVDSAGLGLRQSLGICHCTTELDQMFFMPESNPDPSELNNFAIKAQCMDLNKSDEHHTVYDMSTFCMCTDNSGVALFGNGECFTVNSGVEMVLMVPYCDDPGYTGSCPSCTRIGQPMCFMYAVLMAFSGAENTAAAIGDKGTILRYSDQLVSPGVLKPVGVHSSYARVVSNTCGGCPLIKNIQCSNPAYCSYPSGCAPFDCLCSV